MIRRHPLAAYYLLSLAIAGAVMVAAQFVAVDVLGGLRRFLHEAHLTTSAVGIIRYAVAEQPWAWLILVFAGAPSVAAVVVTLVQRGGAFGRLMARWRPWGRDADRARALRCYAAILVASGLMMLWYYRAGTRAAAPDALAFRDAALGTAPLAIAAKLFLGHLTDEGGTFEELGWRGFALPLLLERLGSPLKASLALGVIWHAWHLPREVPALMAGVPLGTFVAGQAWFLALTVGLSVLATWAFLETGGSVLPAVLIHGGTNVWSKALAEPLYPSLSWPVDPRTAVVLALAAVVLAVRWPALTAAGDRPRPAPNASPV